MKPATKPHDPDLAALLEQARRTLDAQARLSPAEASRLRDARRRALETKRAPLWRPAPAGALAMALSVALATVLWVGLPRMEQAPPADLAQVEDLELLLTVDDAFWLEDPAFVQWVLEEAG